MKDNTDINNCNADYLDMLSFDSEEFPFTGSTCERLLTGKHCPSKFMMCVTL